MRRLWFRWHKITDKERKVMIILGKLYASTDEAFRVAVIGQYWPKGYILMGEDGNLYEWI